MEKNSNHGSEPVGKMQRETEVIFQAVPAELLLNIIEQLPLKSVISLTIASKSTVLLFNSLLNTTFWKKQFERRTVYDNSRKPTKFDYVKDAKRRLAKSPVCQCTDGCMDNCSCVTNNICCDEDCGCKCVHYESVRDIPRNPAKNKHNKASRAFRGNPYNVMRSVNVKLPVFDADLTPCAKDNIPLFRNKRQLQKVLRRVVHPCCSRDHLVSDFITTSDVYCNCHQQITWKFSFCYLSLSSFVHWQCCKRCESRNMQDHDLICPDYFAQWVFSVNKIGKPDLEGLHKYRNKMAKFFETKNIGVLYN
jgi:hypothetical protein